LTLRERRTITMVS